jgi:hypothetical protein
MRNVLYNILLYNILIVLLHRTVCWFTFITYCLRLETIAIASYNRHSATGARSMPYSIHRVHFGKYNVINEVSKKTMGTFPTRRQALGQIRALYANEPGAVLTKRLNEPSDPKLWEQAKEEAKKKFQVYPSAYANAWASRWYKERGGSWRKVDLKQKSDEMNNKKPAATAEKKSENQPVAPFVRRGVDVNQLTQYEQMLDEKPVEESDKQTAVGASTEKSSSSKEKSNWLREPWVDISRPVIDESGIVIGFHPCGNSTSAVRDSMDRYRTSYPKCMPRSKAMRLNAIQREELIRRTRPFANSIEGNHFQESEEEEGEE